MNQNDPDKIQSLFNSENKSIQTVSIEDYEIQFFMEDTPERYEFYFLFDKKPLVEEEDVDKDQIKKDIIRIKEYLMKEGFLDNILMITQNRPDKLCKIHHFFRYKPAHVWREHQRNYEGNYNEGFIPKPFRILGSIMLLFFVAYWIMRLFGVIF